MSRPQNQKRRICFVTGSRAEFGLMQSTLRAIQNYPKLKLQVIATGMHLDPTHGNPLSVFSGSKLKPDLTVPWDPSSSTGLTAAATGEAIAGLALAFARLNPD